jgi:hypothetical protein
MNLSEIQSKLKAPKGQTNTFGGYKYRSCEDIVEAVKPLLAKCDGSLVINDEIVGVGERVYVKATAVMTIKDKEWSSSAYAREPLTKKGMDEAQITGATSSYARKYALNGLLAIDDTKDADTMDNRQARQGKPSIADASDMLSITDAQVTAIEKLLKASGGNDEAFLKYLNINSVSDMQQRDYDAAFKLLEKKVRGKQ